MDKPQVFWDAFRKRWRFKLSSWDEDQFTTGWTTEWTKLIISAAKEACFDYANNLDIQVNVSGEQFCRLDVHATNQLTGDLVVAFESELAYWGRNGNSGKDWRQEFSKLCSINADLRVLSSTIKPGTVQGFRAELTRLLTQLRPKWEQGYKGDFCLIFGTENRIIDHNQPWMAFSLESDFTLRELTSSILLYPHRVITGTDPSTE